MEQGFPTNRAAGYTDLLERYGLSAMPNWHRSLVSTGSVRRTDSTTGEVVDIYPSQYWPGESPSEHLEFALKYDGTNLGLLAVLLPAIGADEIVRFVRSKPTGKYARRIWYFYEMLTGELLPLADMTQGNYVDLLDSEQYFTTSTPQQIRRQKINNNLLGTAEFCPTIRRTETLQGFEEADLSERCKAVVSDYPPELLKRALSYLYTKETKSSFEIEHITPNSTRTERFIAMLQLAEKDDFCEKARLIDLQNRVVDPRFMDTDYRTVQNYVGESVAWQREKIHYACPKPEDLASLMGGLIAAHTKMGGGEVPPVIHAAAIAYGFVFLHPFEDGNGRIHRFLIHNILACRGFTPEGIMFPISASMLKHAGDYDASLEAFSRPLMPLIEYSLADDGRMTIENDTAKWYAYIDLTPQTEALFRFIEHTINTELVEELSFLAKYDQTKRAIQDIVDMPDRKIDQFIRFCLQNSGTLSRRKRESHFELLTDGEIERLEQAVAEGYRLGETGSSE